MHEFVMALGLVAVIEGLVLALAPLRFEDLLKTLSQISFAQRRTIGLAIVALGVAVVWVANRI